MINDSLDYIKEAYPELINEGLGIKSNYIKQVSVLFYMVDERSCSLFYNFISKYDNSITNIPLPEISKDDYVSFYAKLDENGNYDLYFYTINKNILHKKDATSYKNYNEISDVLDTVDKAFNELNLLFGIESYY